MKLSRRVLATFISVSHIWLKYIGYKDEPLCVTKEFSNTCSTLNAHTSKRPLPTLPHVSLLRTKPQKVGRWFNLYLKSMKDVFPSELRVWMGRGHCASYYYNTSSVRGLEGVSDCLKFLYCNIFGIGAHFETARIYGKSLPCLWDWPLFLDSTISGTGQTK